MFPLISSSILGTWGVHLSLSYLFAFSYCSWGLKAIILKWFAIPFSSKPHFVRTLHHDLSMLGGPTQHVRWLGGITDLMYMTLSKFQKLVMDREAWCAAVHGLQTVGHDWVTELSWWFPYCAKQKPCVLLILLVVVPRKVKEWVERLGNLPQGSRSCQENTRCSSTQLPHFILPPLPLPSYNPTPGMASTFSFVGVSHTYFGKNQFC